VKVVLLLAELVVSLSEFVVECSDERAGFLMLPLVVFPFLHMLNLDVHCETLGHKMEFVAKPFHQHTTMALGLVGPVVDPVIDFIKSAIKILNQFLIHTASAATLNSKPFSLSCQ
jgi:hypothetical protein